MTRDLKSGKYKGVIADEGLYLKRKRLSYIDKEILVYI